MALGVPLFWPIGRDMGKSEEKTIDPTGLPRLLADRVGMMEPENQKSTDTPQFTEIREFPMTFTAELDRLEGQRIPLTGRISGLFLARSAACCNRLERSP